MNKLKLFPKYLLLLSLAVGLFIFDINYSNLNTFRSEVGDEIYKFISVIDKIEAAWQQQTDYAKSKYDLIQHNKKLTAQIAALKAKLHTMLHSESENKRFREFLQLQLPNDMQYSIAEVVRVNSHLTPQQVIINKGYKQGVKLEQIAIDSYGVYGKVIEVSANFSRVLLVSAQSSLIPGINQRSALRGIIRGNGNKNALSVIDIPQGLDFKVGDLLLTSGLDGQYPPGLLIGTVTAVAPDPTTKFAEIKLQPAAKLGANNIIVLLEKG